MSTILFVCVCIFFSLCFVSFPLSLCDIDICSPVIDNILPYRKPEIPNWDKYAPLTQSSNEYQQALQTLFPPNNLTFLPGYHNDQGYPIPLPETHFTGYLPISTKIEEFSKEQLFYWFQGYRPNTTQFKAWEIPEDIPIIWWMEGGPGCASSGGAVFGFGSLSLQWSDDYINQHGSDGCPPPPTSSPSLLNNAKTTGKPFWDFQKSTRDLRKQGKRRKEKRNEILSERPQRDAEREIKMAEWESEIHKSFLDSSEESPPPSYPFRVFTNPYRWNQLGHLFFMDAPIGTGWSSIPPTSNYTSKMEDFTNEMYGTIYNFFQLKEFSHLRRNPIYLVGESYGGRWIPSFSYFVQQMNLQSEIKNCENSKDNNINGTCSEEYFVLPIVGAGLGNPWLDPITQTSVFGCQFHQAGLLHSPELNDYNKNVTICAQFVNASIASDSEDDWTDAGDYCDSLYDGLLNATGPNGNIIDDDDQRFWALDPCDPENETLIDAFYNHLDTMRALKLSALSMGSGWTWCSDIVPTFWEGDEMRSSLPVIPSLWTLPMFGTQQGSPHPPTYLHSVVYVGNMDLVCGVPSIERVFRRKILPNTEIYDCLAAKKFFWQTPITFSPKGNYSDDTMEVELSGFVILFPNPSEDGGLPTDCSAEIPPFPRLQFVTVLEAGHVVTIDQPKRSLDLAFRLITKTSFINGDQQYSLDILDAEDYGKDYQPLPLGGGCLEDGDSPNDDDDDTKSLRIMLIVLLSLYVVTVTLFGMAYYRMKSQFNELQNQQKTINGHFQPIPSDA